MWLDYLVVFSAGHSKAQEVQITPICSTFSTLRSYCLGMQNWAIFEQMIPQSYSQWQKSLSLNRKKSFKVLLCFHLLLYFASILLSKIRQSPPSFPLHWLTLEWNKSKKLYRCLVGSKPPKCLNFEFLLLGKPPKVLCASCYLPAYHQLNLLNSLYFPPLLLNFQQH